MKFKFKALVAAVALVGAVGQASAATGATDLVFYAWDNASATSFMYDLGSSFNPNTTTIAPLTVATGSDWSSFTTAAGANWVTSVQWGVFKNLDGSAVGSTVHIGAATTATNVTTANNQIFNLATAADLNAVGKTHFGSGGTIDNVLTSFVKAGTSTYLGNLWNAGNAVGASNVAFDSIVSAGRAGNVLTTYTPSNGNGFAFDGSKLQYNVAAAVPEPETYAMLSAGLLMLGAFARRRRG